jgi:hypothetical protein
MLLNQAKNYLCQDTNEVVLIVEPRVLFKEKVVVHAESAQAINPVHAAMVGYAYVKEKSIVINCVCITLLLFLLLTFLQILCCKIDKFYA